ncbi:TolC family outer membrane protein [Sphingomonas sabuli]|uniref:TolC family outer membrane protein n=1 Tax=Sphingomonas sabuli TaxID=2764186 RepID=A0A7G9L1U6_9SPHN|nr:TolC family outer membrane protein [Sphingomonas sabuli]QNM82595.1 TolC family outer membrane protein [Sphingomonas sabuli]
MTVPRTRALFIGTMAAALMAGPAWGATLRQALVAAYRTNPTLMAEREQLRATDANVAIARAAGRPQVVGTVGVNRNLTRSGIILQQQGDDHNISLSGGVDLNVPLYSGGRVKNSVRAAKTRVEAGRATLDAVEGDVFTEAVAAYMDVIRDRAIVELNQNNVRVLSTNLEATSDRFEIGDVTRTDVAQSQARLELARSNLATAGARLATSVENYKRVIGEAPDALAPPDPLPPLPATPEEAVRIALVNNPDLFAVNQQAVAAGYDVRVARSQRLPTIGASASGDYINQLTGDTGPFVTDRSGTATSVAISGSIPIYQGGEPAARIRRAQALEGQVLEQVIGVERAVVANTRAAFASYRAALQAIESSNEAVSATELALEGNRAELSVGTRDVLDLLNAEQELLNAQVTLVSSRRDAYVAGFQLLNAMGETQAEDLNLDGGVLYDPLGNYRRVAGNWNDWANDPRHVPVATPTANVPTPPTPVVAGDKGVTPPRQ